MSFAIYAALNYFLIRLRHFLLKYLTANHKKGCLYYFLFDKKNNPSQNECFWQKYENMIKRIVVGRIIIFAVQSEI